MNLPNNLIYMDILLCMSLGLFIVPFVNLRKLTLIKFTAGQCACMWQFVFCFFRIFCPQI